jgi:hypothetical protein
MEGSPELIQQRQVNVCGGISSSHLDSTAPILKPEASLATEQAPTEPYGRKKKTLEDSPGIIHNRSGFVELNLTSESHTTEEKSPTTTAEGRNIELQECRRGSPFPWQEYESRRESGTTTGPFDGEC